MCQVAVSNLAATYAAYGTSLTGGEGREVVVEEEAFATLVDNVVDNLLVELGAECDGGERLSLATGEYGRSVRSGDVVDFAPDGADVGGLTTVETDSFVEDATAHGFFFDVVVVAFYEGSLLVAFLLGE